MAAGDEALRIETTPTRIADALFLGSAYDAASWWFVHCRIANVVNCADASACGLVTMPFVVSSTTLNALDAPDYPLFERHLAPFVDFMVRARGGGSVMVHCHEGRNRSVALLCAMIILVTGGTAADVIAEMRRRRGPGVLTNSTFEDALRKGEGWLRGVVGEERARALRAAWGEVFRNESGWGELFPAPSPPPTPPP